MIPNDFKGAARRLDALDIVQVAQLIGVGEDEIRAILEVESRGSGFDRQGRPAMLFEPHVFWKELGPGPKRDAAAKAGLAYPKWKAGAYPKDSYPRLRQATQIDFTAALRSASWGLGQVMGFNHKAAGFNTVQDMVAAFCRDEETHLEAMIRFIKARGLADEIQRRDWAGFARAYNGPGYATNRYDKRLAQAYAKWVQVPNAQFDLDEARKEDEAACRSQTFLDVARIRAVQEKLIALGYHMVGRADGSFGPRTAGAIAAFEAENGFEVRGKIDQALIDRLETAEPHEPSPERQTGTPQDSVTKTADAIKKGSIVAGAVVGGDQAIDTLGKVEAAQSYVERVLAIIKPLRELVADHWPLLLIGGAAYIAWRAHGAVTQRIAEYREGKTP